MRRPEILAERRRALVERSDWHRTRVVERGLDLERRTEQLDWAVQAVRAVRRHPFAAGALGVGCLAAGALFRRWIPPAFQAASLLALAVQGWRELRSNAPTAPAGDSGGSE